MTPQLIMVFLVCFGIGGSLFRHGDPKTGNHNFIADIITAAIGQSLLYWGGFYDELIRRLSQ